MRHIYKVYERPKSDFLFLKAITLISMIASICGLFFYAMTTTLDDMTRVDCEIHKIQAACEALK